MSDGDLTRATAAATGRNPFVTIPYRWRLAVVTYAIIWQILPQAVTTVFYHSDQEYAYLRLLFETANILLLLVPFFVKRLGGTPTGWLHPLVFTTLFTYAAAALQNTSSLLNPFTVWFRPIDAPFSHQLLHGWLAIDVAEAHLKGEVLVLLSTASLYVGFLLFRPRVPNLRFGRARGLNVRLLSIFLLLLAITLLFVESNGGIVQHISSFGRGRFRALGGLGHITAVIGFAPALMAVWYIFDSTVIRRPWFIALVPVALAMQFITNGSRGATMVPLALLACAWIYHHRRIPAARVLAIGAFALVGIGVLGTIRTSSWSGGRADFSALTEFDMMQSLETANEELDARNQNAAFLPVMAFVPDRVGLLWGRTYVGAIAFFIPRAIWTGKPRGAGPHTAAMIFRGLDTADGYEGGGIPPGPVAEAYWNFHIPGVIIVFGVFGIFRRWLTELLQRHDGRPAVVAFYVLAIFYTPSPASDCAIDLFQKTGVLFIVYVILGVFLFRSSAGSATPVAGGRWARNVARR